MSVSEQHNLVAQVFVVFQATFGGPADRNLLDEDVVERRTMLDLAQQGLRRVAQYTEPTSIVQRVHDHPSQILALQKQVTDLQAQPVLPPQCYYTVTETRIKVLTSEGDKARRTPAAPGTDEEVQEQSALMT